MSSVIGVTVRASPCPQNRDTTVYSRRAGCAGPRGAHLLGAGTRGLGLAAEFHSPHHVAKLLKSTWGGHINMAISYSVEAIIPLLGDDRKAELSRGGATARRAWERAGCWIPKSDVSSEGHSPSIGNRTTPTDSFCRRGQKERQVGTSLRAWNRTRGQIAPNPRRVLPDEPHRNNPPPPKTGPK